MQRTIPPAGSRVAQLLSLDAANLFVVRGDGKYGYREKAAEFGNVVGLAIQQNHSNSSGGGGASYLRMRGRTGRFEEDGVGPRSGRGLDAGQQLLALHDAIVAGINDVNLDPQFAGCLLGSRSLLDLVIVVVVGQRERKRSFFMPWVLLAQSYPDAAVDSDSRVLGA